MEDFTSIIDAHHPILYKIGRSYTRNNADFDDLYQEMLIQVYSSLKNFRKESKISTWIYRVALNTALTFSRGNGKQKNQTLREEMGELAGEGPLEEMGDDGMDPVDLLYECINELRKEERALILLHLEGKSYGEIAEIMGISTSNTGVRLLRIKSRLKELLKSKGYEGS